MNNSLDLVKVDIQLGQIPTPVIAGNTYTAPSGMSLSFDGQNLTVDTGSVTSTNFAFNFLTKITKNVFSAWEEGNEKGASLDADQQLKWTLPIMSSNTNEDGYVVAANENVDTAYLAFDGDAETSWKTETIPTYENPSKIYMTFPTKHNIDSILLTLKNNQPSNIGVFLTSDGGTTWENYAVFTNNKDNEENLLRVKLLDINKYFNGILVEFYGAVNKEAECVELNSIEVTEYLGKRNVFAIGNAEKVDFCVSYSESPVFPTNYPFHTKIGEINVSDDAIISVWPTKDLVSSFLDNDVNKALEQKADKTYVDYNLYLKVDKVSGKSLVDDTQIEKLFNLVNFVDLGYQESEAFLDTEIIPGFYGYTLTDLPENQLINKYLIVNRNEDLTITQYVCDGIHTKTRVYTPEVTEPEVVPATWSAWVDNYLITPEFLEKLEEDFDKKADKEVVDEHIANKENPHAVTKAQVGLGSVDNTSDADKPISTATQEALDRKQPVGDYALKSELPDTSNFATKTEVSSGLESKADKATTLSGYGITDAYTKTESDGRYATTAQGTKADTAVQPSEISDMLTKTEAAETYITSSGLATVAKTGSYNDLTDKPEAYILPKASTTVLGGVKVDGTTITATPEGVITAVGGGTGGTTNYAALTNKPQINSIELTGNKSLDDLGIQAAGDYALKTELPTKVSQLQNDSKYLTSVPAEYVTETELAGKGYITNTELTEGLSTKVNTADLSTVATTGSYNDLTDKPEAYSLPKASTTILGGVKVDGTTITSNAEGVITAIGGGTGGTTDYTALTNKPQINSIELSGNKTLGELGIQEAGDYALSSSIPTKVSQLQNDSNFLTSIPSEYLTNNVIVTSVSASSTDSEVPSARCIYNLLGNIEQQLSEI